MRKPTILVDEKPKQLEVKYVHYTRCVIEFIDDKTREEVIIKSTHDVIDDEDDEIFYYGLSIFDIIDIYNRDDVVDNEFKIIDILEVENE